MRVCMCFFFSKIDSRIVLLKIQIGKYQLIRLWFSRFLSTGDSFGTIAFNFRMGHSTVRVIVHETCEAIGRRLSPRVLPEPTAEMWNSTEKTFSERWNFPNCIGALDGKHIVIEAPRKSGSLYFNYKKTFSIVLMALVDADYRFIAVDVGAYGKNSDSGIFSNSSLGKALNEGRFNIPADKPLPGTDDPVPHVIVGDEAFPLQRNIMRPYPGSQLDNDESKRIFNYRLSRARRISENAFGILTQKFRIFQRRIKMNPGKVDKIVLAACCLHNFMLTRDDRVRTSANTNGNSNDAPQQIRDVENIACNAAIKAIAIRETLKNYFSSAIGSVPWQMEMVRLRRRNV